MFGGRSCLNYVGVGNYLLLCLAKLQSWVWGRLASAIIYKLYSWPGLCRDCLLYGLTGDLAISKGHQDPATPLRFKWL